MRWQNSFFFKKKYILGRKILTFFLIIEIGHVFQHAAIQWRILEDTGMWSRPHAHGKRSATPLLNRPPQFASIAIATVVVRDNFQQQTEISHMKKQIVIIWL